MTGPRYGLYFARATCEGCGSRLLKRQVHVAIRPHEDTCPACSDPVLYRRAKWSLYVYWMKPGGLGCRYVQADLRRAP
jgi:hypothetical protein